jgi:DNA repair protein RecN (Recombination protein N)
LADDLGGHLKGMKSRLEALDSGAKGLKVLMQAVADTQSDYTRLALAATQGRRSAARELDSAMALELAPLKMERAVFSTEFSTSEPGPDGVDLVTFTVATNPGAPAGPLNKIASGGELSRFLLALKVCLTGQTPGLTMIFDEIDRGVGGATADAVGRRLQHLSASGQILVVTHSPQVAARGAHHWRVEKRVEGQQTLSTVVPLSPSDRVEEIARMLAGDTITDAARQAARALLGQGG